jgi:hypothetical protein
MMGNYVEVFLISQKRRYLRNLREKFMFGNQKKENENQG